MKGGVVVTPVILRIRSLDRSERYRFPAASKASPCTFVNTAFVAGIPSTVGPKKPPPAIVLIVPPVSTLRTRPAEPMKRFPAPSTVRAKGEGTPALVAGPPSPETGVLLPMPATVVMVPLGSTRLTRPLPWSAI